MTIMLLSKVVMKNVVFFLMSSRYWTRSSFHFLSCIMFTARAQKETTLRFIVTKATNPNGRAGITLNHFNTWAVTD